MHPHLPHAQQLLQPTLTPSATTRGPLTPEMVRYSAACAAGASERSKGFGGRAGDLRVVPLSAGLRAPTQMGLADVVPGDCIHIGLEGQLCSQLVGCSHGCCVFGGLSRSAAQAAPMEAVVGLAGDESYESTKGKLYSGYRCVAASGCAGISRKARVCKRERLRVHPSKKCTERPSSHAVGAIGRVVGNHGNPEQHRITLLDALLVASTNLRSLLVVLHLHHTTTRF